MPAKKLPSSMLCCATLILLTAVGVYQTAHAKQQQRKEKPPIEKPIPIPAQGTLISPSLDIEAKKFAEGEWKKLFNSTWTPGYHYTLWYEVRPATFDPNERAYTLMEIEGLEQVTKRTADFLDRTTKRNRPNLEWVGTSVVRIKSYRQMWWTAGIAEFNFNRDAKKWSPYRESSSIDGLGDAYIEKENGRWSFQLRYIRYPFTAPTDEQLTTGKLPGFKSTTNDPDDLKRERSMESNQSAEHNADQFVETHFTECNGAFYTVEIDPSNKFRVLQLPALRRKLEALSLEGEDSNVIWKGKLTISAPSYQIFYASKGSAAGGQGVYVGSVILKLRNKPFHDRPNTLWQEAVFASDPNSTFPLRSSYALDCGYTPQQLSTITNPDRILKWGRQ